MAFLINIKTTTNKLFTSIYLLLLLLTKSNFGHSQVLKENSIGLEYNNAHVSRNIALVYNTQLSVNTKFYLGVKYLINNRTVDNQANVWMKRFWARESFQHFGLKTGFEFDFYKKKKFNQALYFFYDFQLTSAPLRQEFFEPTLIVNDTTVLYKKTILFYTKPAKAFESTFGFGLRAKLTPQVIVKSYFGIGFAYLISPKNDPLIIPFNKSSYQLLTGIMGLGINYSLRNRVKALNSN